MSEWQSIETAPKDGRGVLVCFNYENIIYAPTTAFWASYHPNAKGKECWRTLPLCGNKLNPTHWMPLPDRITK